MANISNRNLNIIPEIHENIGQTYSVQTARIKRKNQVKQCGDMNKSIISSSSHTIKMTKNRSISTFNPLEVKPNLQSKKIQSTKTKQTLGGTINNKSIKNLDNKLISSTQHVVPSKAPKIKASVPVVSKNQKPVQLNISKTNLQQKNTKISELQTIIKSLSYLVQKHDSDINSLKQKSITHIPSIHLVKQQSQSQFPLVISKETTSNESEYKIKQLQSLLQIKDKRIKQLQSKQSKPVLQTYQNNHNALHLQYLNQLQDFLANTSQSQSQNVVKQQIKELSVTINNLKSEQTIKKILQKQTK